jgi:hypothetical protein
LRKGGGKLRIPLGQRSAHMTPERRLRIRDLRGELLVGAGDVLPKVKAGNVRAPASLAGVGDLTEDVQRTPRLALAVLERVEPDREGDDQSPVGVPHFRSELEHVAVALTRMQFAHSVSRDQPTPACALANGVRHATEGARTAVLRAVPGIGTESTLSPAGDSS